MSAPVVCTSACFLVLFLVMAYVRQYYASQVQHPFPFLQPPRELRDKVYFLSFRPDCSNTYLDGFRRCNKLHVHADKTSFQAALKWLQLGRQIWAEAYPYAQQLTKLDLILRLDQMKDLIDCAQHTNLLRGQVFTYRDIFSPLRLNREIQLLRLRHMTL